MMFYKKHHMVVSAYQTFELPRRMAVPAAFGSLVTRSSAMTVVDAAIRRAPVANLGDLFR
jgi:hypothetical protein